VADSCWWLLLLGEAMRTAALGRQSGYHFARWHFSALHQVLIGGLLLDLVLRLLLDLVRRGAVSRVRVNSVSRDQL